MQNRILKTELHNWKDLEWFQPKEIKKYDTEVVKKLKTSMTNNGFVAPFHVWFDGEKTWILDGHYRKTAMTELEKDGENIPAQLPCNFIDCKDSKEAKKLVLVYNSHYAKIQSEPLLDWIKDLDLDEILGEIEIPGLDLDSLLNINEIEEDTPPDVPEEAISKIGDLYEFHSLESGLVHRVLCGDSTKIEDVQRLMGGRKADLVFTDPPYGVAYTGGIQFKGSDVVTNNRKMINGDKDDSIYQSVIPVIAEFCNGACYVWFAGTKATKVYQAIEEVGDIHSLIIWVKNGGYGALNANYKQKHEPCLYWKPKGKTLNFVGATTETTVWELDKDGINKLHPTQKPVSLPVKAIMNHRAGLVLDLFLGSGTTLIACEQTKRNCYGMELEPLYVDVIVNRYKNYMGKNGLKYEIKKAENSAG